MKSQEIKYVGIDCGKKTLEVIRIGDNSLHQIQQFSTTEIGISKLINWLNPNDVVAVS
ncbi:IS110 family transposase [Leptospira interrogans serovar Australis]|nr:IS110 family transposase [Leptospira interrogans serovar Australis]